MIEAFILSTFDSTVCTLLVLHALCDVRNDALHTVAKLALSKRDPIGSQSLWSCKHMGRVAHPYADLFVRCNPWRREG